MSAISSQSEEDSYQFDAHSDDDAYSTGGDSGFSMGQDDLDKLDVKPEKQMKDEKQVQVDEQQQQKEEVTPAPSSSVSFFSRLVSIPIIQDSFMGAQNIVRQHAVGQRALDYAETKFQTIAVSAKPYLSNEENHAGRLFSKANTLGNKSLDLLERQFPSISTPTNELVQPVAGRIENAVSHILTKKTQMVDPRIDYIARSFESLIDQYLPEEEEQNDAGQKEKEQKEEPYNKDLHGMDRLMNVVNVLSTRASKRISKKATVTIDEERQIKQMIRAWVLEQANTMTHQPMLQDSMESFKTKFFHENSLMQVMYSFTQTEFSKLRQELRKENVSPLDKIRNILVLSQTDIIVPLYEKSRSIIKQDKPAAEPVAAA